jgi:DNA-binding beta-propeller fold protein YncE
MSVRLKTRVAQLSIVAGIQQRKASNIGLMERSSIIPIGTGKGNLYLLVEVTGDPIGKEGICRELIEILSKEYLRVPGGITNGLRQAIRAANRFLYQNNLYSIPERHRTGFTSCAVLRGKDLYMGLAGDALIYVVRGQESRLFPPPLSRHPAHTLSEERPALPPLGAEEYLREVGLFHCHIQMDDTILLASSTLPLLASQQQVTKAAQGGLGEMTRTLTSLAPHTDLSALLIHTRVEQREEVLRKESLAARGRSFASGVMKVPVGEVAAGVKRIPTRRIASGLGTMVSALWALIVAFFVGLARRVQASFSWLVSSGIFEALGRGVRAAFAGMLRGTGAMAKRMLPEPAVAPQPMETVHARRPIAVSTSEGSRFLPVVGALTIICAIGLIAAGVVIFNRSRSAHFSQLLEEAQSEWELAESSSAPTAIREHLGKAHELIEQALGVRPSDPEAVALQEEILLTVDEMNRVVRLQFSTYVPFLRPENQPRRVVLDSNDAYVLDKGTKELYGYLLDELSGFQEPAGGAVLLAREDRPAGAAIQELDDFAWMEAGNGRETSNLLLLVNGGSLLQLDDARGFTSVSVADSQLWGEPHRIGGYFGYLYVLDTQEDRIWKYAPTGNSYDLPPANYLQAETSVELDSAVDMTIDGYIYVLLADGNILRFSGGLEEAFSVSGLDDQEFQTPTAIFASPETDYIYVADAGNERVVQLDKDGAFIRQFRSARENAEAFQDLQDVFVSEAKGELFVLNSDGLYLALIPEILRPE